MLKKELLLASAGNETLVNHRLVATFEPNGEYLDSGKEYPLNSQLQSYDYVFEGETGVCYFPNGRSVGWRVSPTNPKKIVTYPPDITVLPDYDASKGLDSVPVVCIYYLYGSSSFAPYNNVARIEVHAETSAGKTVEVPLESFSVTKITGDYNGTFTFGSAGHDTQEVVFNGISGTKRSLGVTYPLFTVNAKTEDGIELSETFHLLSSILCFSADTEVLMADGSTKLAKDIQVGDMVKVWDFDNACYAEAPLFWVKKAEVSPMYQRIVTNTGRVLKQINNHRMFSLTNNTFEQCQSILGHKVWTVDGEETVVSAEFVHEPIEYYNAVSHYHMNLICNGFLTSCRFNNLYPIKDMKFIKEDRPVRKREEFNVPDSWFYGVRLSETTKTVKEVEDYVKAHEAASA